MPIAEARVETDRASRYLVQLCQHAQQLGRHANHDSRARGDGHAPPEVQHAEWADTQGTVRLSLGQWTMRATADALTLRAEADDEENLRRIQDLVATRLEKIGRRDHLTVNWRRLEATGLQPEPHRTAGAKQRVGALGRVVLAKVSGIGALAARHGHLPTRKRKDAH